MKDREPGLREVWNVWFTLMLVAAAFTVVTLILEALGIFKGLGVILNLAGIAATVIFGILPQPEHPWSGCTGRPPGLRGASESRH